MKYLIILLVAYLPMLSGCMLFNHDSHPERECPGNLYLKHATVYETGLCNLPYSVDYVDRFLRDANKTWVEIVGDCNRIDYAFNRLQIVWYSNTSQCEPCDGDDKINGWYDACQQRIWVRKLGSSAGQTAVFHELCRFLASECYSEKLPTHRDDWPEKYQEFVRIMKNNFMQNSVSEKVIKTQG